ncbi:MAG: extracellular solute-binding protein, partial [Anaerolineae bacterium]|nr:extracellular solute-binding protein [Anaerolineae bacterium]
PPDVMFIQEEPLPKYADKGLYMDMDPLVERDAAELNLDDFFPGVQEIFMWDAEAQKVNQGIRYAMPAEGGPTAWFMNLDVFEAAGAKIPEENGENWTIDDWVEAMDRIRVLRPDGGLERAGFAIAGLRGAKTSFLWTLSNMEADYLNEDRTRCTMDSPASIAAHEVIWKWIFEDRFCPLEGQDMVGLSGVDMFTSGKIGAQMSGPWYFPQLRRASTAEGERLVNWDCFLHPKNSLGNRWTQQSFDGWAIASAAPAFKKEPAWSFIRYMLSNEGQARISMLGRAMPARPSVAYTDAFNRPDTPENEDVFIRSMDFAIPQPVTKYWAEMWQIVSKYYDIIYNPQTKDEMTVAEACQRIAAGVNELLEIGELPTNY